MKYLLTLVLLFASTTSQAQVYKCTSEKGELKFSDSPCAENSKQEKLFDKPPKKHWTEIVQDKAPESVEVSKLTQQDDDVFIHYSFANSKDASDFMTLVYETSQITTVLLKYVEATSEVRGRAELKISSKPNALAGVLESKEQEKSVETKDQ
ncbi:DUF4124 domain-containing protein [Glaciecola sp. MH2013]|uniref:DUF4124 domain-containing protein n=1 Tax=Glaciecola sp. MH2013 TaxID=2785524 RepID=UPI00189EEA83|nr:DUF4124 domain-containing protein [Glaciecola sp. MH2013]MBF7072302.1 DUF4124 domain-containing protein [Glaciecola sp. MH2013]